MEQTKKISAIIVVIFLSAAAAQISKFVFAERNIIRESIIFLAVFSLGIFIANKYFLKKNKP